MKESLSLANQPAFSAYRGKSVELRILLEAANQGASAAVLFIDAAESRVNLLSSELMNELAAAVAMLESGFIEVDSAGGRRVERKVAGLVVVSGKPDSFIAGADIKEILKARTLPPSVAYQGCQGGKALFARISALPFATVAAIHGRCLGGGTELALACSYRLASSSKKTVIGLPEVGLGVLPGWGGSVKTPKMVGFAPAVAMVLNPLKPWRAAKAWQRGLVSEVVAEQDLHARALAIALGAKPKLAKPSAFARLTRTLADSRPARYLVGKAALAFARLALGKGYPAPAAVLEVMNAAFDSSQAQAFEMESAAFARLCHSDACGHLVQKFLDYQKSKKKS